ncbi:MAG: Rrf2 family transcriptional regulator [bacterium]|nr:Rrf2 family transcriptional regulator [bacterium]
MRKANSSESGEIATRQNLPIRFLELVFSRLRATDIVKSTRGAAGGYQLARVPQEITLAEVISVCEGSSEFVLPSTVTERVGPDDPIGKSLVKIMNEQFALLHRNLAATTLADIIRSSGLAAEMYWI